MALANIMAQMQIMNNQYQQMQQGFPQHHCCPPQHFPHPSWSQGLPDASVGQRPGFFGPQETKGYGVDLNHNGRYDRGRDGVLAFDLNHDGKIDDKEVQGSNERLKAFGGNYDLNGDGKTTMCERIKGGGYQREMQRKDANHDGVLDGNEIAQGGGRVLIDHNRDGHTDASEQYNPNFFPTRGGHGRGSIDYVDPRNNSVQTTNWGGFCRGW